MWRVKSRGQFRIVRGKSENGDFGVNFRRVGDWSDVFRAADSCYPWRDDLGNSRGNEANKMAGLNQVMV